MYKDIYKEERFPLLNKEEKQFFFFCTLHSHSLVLQIKLQPKTRICYMNSSALRASRYDRDAEKGRGTRLRWFYGYKLHVVLSEDLLPLIWDLSPANFYDNQFGHLMKELSNHDVFFLLADAAYDDKKLFLLAESYGFHLVTQVNKRKTKSPNTFRGYNRKENWLFVNVRFGKKLLSKRTKIERFFAMLKVNYGLEQPSCSALKDITVMFYG